MKMLWIALLFLFVSCASNHTEERNPASVESLDDGITAESYMINR